MTLSIFVARPVSWWSMQPVSKKLLIPVAKHFLSFNHNYLKIKSNTFFKEAIPILECYSIFLAQLAVEYTECISAEE